MLLRHTIVRYAIHNTQTCIYNAAAPTETKYFYYIKKIDSVFFLFKCIVQDNRRLTPKNIFLLESKPAAYILAFGASVRSTKILQANRDIVLCITFASFLSPGSVSITTKSIGDSDDRPTWKETEKRIQSNCIARFVRVSVVPIIGENTVLYRSPGFWYIKFRLQPGQNLVRRWSEIDNFVHEYRSSYLWKLILQVSVLSSSFWFTSFIT